MSRRRRAEKRKVIPDPVYQSVTVEKFINKIMMGGKKSLARSITYTALKEFSERVKMESPLGAFEQALETTVAHVPVLLQTLIKSFPATLSTRA